MLATLWSGLSGVLSFVVLISVVVFFHELGHLIVGKALGVKAIRFSLGFGPRLWGFTLGETEYRISPIPLGGYVKFAGDNPLEELAPEDRGRGFLEQPPLKKAAVAFAGPFANFVLALVLLIGVNLPAHRDLASTIGFVKPGSPAALGGLEPGDRIASVDGAPVRGFLELQEMIRAHAGQPLRLSIVRDGQPRELTVTPAVHEETNPVETVKSGRIGIAANPRLAEIAVVGGGDFADALPAARAGLRNLDLVVKLDGKPIASYEQLSKELGRLPAGASPRLDVLRPRPVATPAATPGVQDPISVQLPPAARPGEFGIVSAELTLAIVQPGSAAQEAGLQRGDRIVSVDGHPALSWYDEAELFQAAAARPVPLVIERDGKALPITVKQHLVQQRDDAGVRAMVPHLGASPDPAIFSLEGEYITVRFGVAEAFRRGVRDTYEVVRTTVLGLQRIVTGRINSEAISGPLGIGVVAKKVATWGFLAFVSLIASISVNLGLLNLLPVPVLDGFHVLSAALEGVRRRPLSIRFREVANMVGLALLLVLMLVAFKNDAIRFME